MKLRMNSAQNRSQNRPKKNVNRKQTDRQNRADLEQLWDHALDNQNADTARRWLKKMSPTRSQNPANIPVKEHLRLASVVALSSSGACGAMKSHMQRAEETSLSAKAIKKLCRPPRTVRGRACATWRAHARASDFALAAIILLCSLSLAL